MRKKKAKPRAKSRAKSKSVPKKKPLSCTKPARKTARKPAKKAVRPTLSAALPGVRYTKRSAPWFRNLPDNRARRGELAYFREGLKEVRKVYGGFENKNGFNLKRLDKLPKKKRDLLHQYISEVNRLRSRREEFLLVKPRTKAERAALVRRTTQGAGTRAHPRKAFYVETGTPRATSLRYVDAPIHVGWRKVAIYGTGVTALEPIIETGLRAEVVMPFKGGETSFRDYLFAEILGWQPGLQLQKGMEGAKLLGLPQDPWQQMLFAMQQLQPLLPRKTPGGKDAYYWVLNSSYGPIGSPSSADDLLYLMRDWYERYEPQDRQRIREGGAPTTFAETIIGVRYIGDEYKAVSGRNKGNAAANLEKRRARYREVARRESLDRKRIRLKDFIPSKKRSKSSKSARLTGRAGRVK